MIERLQVICRNSLYDVLAMINDKMGIKQFVAAMLWIFPALLYSQVLLSPKVLDFGTTSPQTDWIIDVRMKNESGKKDFFLRHTFSHEYEVLFTSKTLMPDSTITMRVKFKPRARGEYKENISLFFANMNEPVIIPVRAVVDYKNPEDNIPCPDFGRLAADCCTDNMFLVEVVDAKTQKPLSGVEVKITEDGKDRMKLRTGDSGKVTQSIPVSYYRVDATAKGYQPNGLSSYINHRKSYFRIELERDETTQIQTVMPVAVLKPEVSDSAVVSSEALPENLFRPNNFVFLLDVSSSMAERDKLDLMKQALLQLTGVLRPGDRIALVTYASEATVVLPSTGGNQKSAIALIVEQLHAGGSTSGAKGFKTSYQLLKKSFIGKGNNQLIVITDGVFQPADQIEIEKLVAKSVKKQFTTSVVGIQCVSFAATKLSDISNAGKGSFLAIDDADDLDVLIEEMKIRSAR
jgi:Ca-activated chloride channel homolog